MSDTQYTVDDQFIGKAPSVRTVYDRLLAQIRTFGAVHEEPKKTSIHLTRKSAFAGVATRKDALQLQLTIKTAPDIRSPRIVKRKQASAHRWHLEVRLESPTEVDRELTSWLKDAMALST